MSEALTVRLDEATSDKRLLEHPFYKAWAEGTLTTEDLGFYSTQYWRQVEAFPGYLEALTRRLEDPEARGIVAENLADEVEGDHPQLWLDFAAGLGVGEDDVRGSAPLSETTACVERFKTAAAQAPLPYALGMLYAYESQTPEVAATKIEGLREHYGIDGAPVEYFALHGELDVEHARDLGRAIERVVTNEEDLEQAVLGAQHGAEATYDLLTGIARERELVTAG